MGTVDWVLLGGAGLLGLVAAGLSGWALFADRSRGRRRCPRCWFDMTGLGMRCPECGREAKSEKRFFRTRRRWRVVAFAAVPLLAGTATALHVRATQTTNGWWANVPTTALIYIVDDQSSAKALGELASRVYERGEPIASQWQFSAPTIVSGQPLLAEGSSVLPLWQQRLIARRCAAHLIADEGFTVTNARGVISSATPTSYGIFCVQSLQRSLDSKATCEVAFELACNDRHELFRLGCEVAARSFVSSGRFTPVFVIHSPPHYPELASDDAGVRATAARMIQDQLRHRGGLAHTSVGMVANSTPAADMLAIGAFGTWLEETERVVGSLLLTIDDPDPEARHAIVMAAWEARGRLDEMIERLVPLEKHEDWRVRRVARRVAERAREIRGKLDDLPYE